MPTATIGITPDLRVVELGDCRTPFRHIEKDIVEENWVKSIRTISRSAFRGSFRGGA